MKDSCLQLTWFPEAATHRVPKHCSGAMHIYKQQNRGRQRTGNHAKEFKSTFKWLLLSSLESPKKRDEGYQMRQIKLDEGSVKIELNGSHGKSLRWRYLGVPTVCGTDLQVKIWLQTKVSLLPSLCFNAARSLV